MKLTVRKIGGKIRVVATAARHFFSSQRREQKSFFRKCLFWDKKSHGIKNYITCILVLNKSVTRNSVNRFSYFFCGRLEIEFFEILLNFFFEKSNKKNLKLLK